MEFYNVKLENVLTGDVVQITKATKRTILKLISELEKPKEGPSQKKIKISKKKIKLKG